MMAWNRQNLLEFVTVPVFDHLVLAGAEEVMRSWNKRQRHNRVAVRKYRLMAVTKVQAPDFDVLIGRASDDHLRI